MSVSEPIQSSIHSSFQVQESFLDILTLSCIVMCTKFYIPSKKLACRQASRTTKRKNKFFFHLNSLLSWWLKTKEVRSEKKRRRLQNKEKELLRLPFKLWNKSSRTFWGLCEVKIHHKFTDFIRFLLIFFNIWYECSIRFRMVSTNKLTSPQTNTCCTADRKKT